MDTAGLADQFPSAVALLNDCFRRNIVANCLPRLDQIFRVTESAWERNVVRLNRRPVQYLLIGEAAPWTQIGDQTRYFYETPSGPWVKRILKVFLKNPSSDAETTLSNLADRGFLLIDTLPFALQYTSQIRRGPTYLKLLLASRDYFLGKLRHPDLRWSSNVKIALAFRLNGLRTIEAYADGIELQSGLRLPLDEKQIAADESNYTGTDKLRKLWALTE